MSAPIFDFSHLTPEERIELAEQLWDSLDVRAVGLTAEEATELRRRRAALAGGETLGEPWRQALDELERGGA
ncbi:MAG: addiction module protein [Gemmatimonadaceae bacterium]|nr:addiction module protein [Gemmatimonadaceae bacterium]